MKERVILSPLKPADKKRIVNIVSTPGGYSSWLFCTFWNYFAHNFHHVTFMDHSSFHVSINDATRLLQSEKTRFVKVLEDGSMTVEYFAPQKIDTQSPHAQDELYIIIEGSSDFFRNGETIKCRKGDVLFVPAKMAHRFINFSDDFATWVIFYGDRKL